MPGWYIEVARETQDTQPAKHPGHRRRPVVLTLVGVAALVLFALPASAQKHRSGDRHRVEGKIDFSYDFEATLEKASESGKPVLAYFTFAT